MAFLVMSRLVARLPWRRDAARTSDTISALDRRLGELERRAVAVPEPIGAAHVDLLLHRLRAEAERAASSTARAVRSGGALPDDLYLDLENEFRGSPDDVRAAQQIYVEDILKVDSACPVVDLGSGRGEFLRLLADHDIDAFGVEPNEAMVMESATRGVVVRPMDLLDFLASAAPATLRAVTMFHVVEHLELGDLHRALQQAHTALVPGGTLIAETPNISNLAVAASGFWVDPTHIRPLHPELLRFLAESAGFEVERRFLHPLATPDNTELPEGQGSAVLQQLINHVYGAQNFAIIARKGV